MKIVAGAYPEEHDIDRWLYFLGNGDCNIVFLWRRAAYIRDVVGRKIAEDVGFRTYAQQLALYNAYKNGTGALAAAPGNSWHEYGLAIDMQRYNLLSAPVGLYYGTANADYDTWMANPNASTTLRKYGLTHAVRGERWHIQPIETIGVSDKAHFADPDDYLRSQYKEKGMLYKGMKGEAVKEWQESLLKCGYKMVNNLGVVCVADGDFGGGTFNGTNLFKKDVGLPQDGIVDELTFGRMLNKLQGMATGIAQSQLDAEIARVADLHNQLSTLSAKLLSIKNIVS